MGNVIKNTHRETSENKLAFKELEKKVILHLGPNTKVEGSHNSFFIYESGSLFGYVNMNNKLISVKNRRNERKAYELAAKLNPLVTWNLETSYFI